MEVINFTFNETTAFTGLLDEQNNPWFVAKEICEILGILDASDATERLDDDEKLIRVLSLSGQGRNTWTVNESGLYNLIFRSNKEEAKAFRKWVTSEVLPEIRRKGNYGAEHILEKESAIQEKLVAIDKKKVEVEDFRIKMNQAKADLDKLNNELHQILKTAPNQLKLFP